MMPLPSSFYGLAYQTGPPLLRGKVLRPLTVQEFTEAGEILLTEARRQDCPYWLLDGRADLPRRQPALYDWLEDEYLPRVRRELGRLPVVALLATASVWQQVQAQGNAAPTRSVLSAAFRLQWFTEEPPALAWIDQYRSSTG